MADDESFMVGKWQVEPALDRIGCEGVVRTVRPQVMELLVYLANRPREVVHTRDLLNDLWDGRIVSDGSVYNCVSELRLALAGNEDEESVVETIPKKGYRLVAAVTAREPAIDPQSRGRRFPIVVAATIAFGVFVLAWYWLQISDAPNGQIRSLVVLPLDSHSPDLERDEYFTNGMTEALISRLSQIRGIKVISRTSAMQLKGSAMTVPEIARTLGVDGVVEGSVLTGDREIRLTLQLIDGKTDSHLWTGTFVRDVDDILDLQDEMANAIAAELQIELYGDTNSAADTKKPITSNVEAYRAYLKGRYYSSKFGQSDFRAALRYYEAAIEFDPDFAMAYASFVDTCMQPLILHNGVRTFEQCEAAANQALALDTNLAEAHAAMSFMHFKKWEWKQAEMSVDRALLLDPSSVLAHRMRAAVLSMENRFEEALSEMQLVEELDPLNLKAKTMVGWPLFYMHKYEAALAQWNDVLEMDPDFVLALYNRGLAYIEMRRPDDVFLAAERVSQIAGADSFESRLLFASGYAISGEGEKAEKFLQDVERDGGQFLAAWIAGVYIMMGDEDRALSRLERGLNERSTDMNTVIEPSFDPVRDHPRFQTVLREMGLADFR